MLPIIAGIFLMATLIAVHFSIRIKPDKKGHILDIDKELPFPAAGQGSSIFSITVFFSVYIGMLILLGIPAMIGIGIGIVAGLLILRLLIIRSPYKSFQQLLIEHLMKGSGSYNILIIFAAITQLLLTASELMILNIVFVDGFGISATNASSLVISISLVGYFYVVMGKYSAVFKTDVIQYLGILLMCLTISAVMIIDIFSGKILLTKGQYFWPLKGYWSILPNHRIIQVIIHMIIGACMGIVFIIASPDTWKRVFIVTKFRNQSGILNLIIVGLLPLAFVFLLIFSRYESSSNLQAMKFLVNLVEPHAVNLNIILMIGIFSSFLSSFDSALITSVHLFMIAEANKPIFYLHDGYVLFNKNIGFAFLIVVLIFFISQNITHNPYLLANLLLGNFTITAGILIGTSFLTKYLTNEKTIWICAILSLLWFLFILNFPGLIEAPTPKQINTIQYGPFLLILTVLLTIALRVKKAF